MLRDTISLPVHPLIKWTLAHATTLISLQVTNNMIYYYWVGVVWALGVLDFGEVRI